MTSKHLIPGHPIPHHLTQEHLAQENLIQKPDPVVRGPSSVLSVYLHIPFCTHRCAYCDFNTYAGQESLIPAYVDALCREIEDLGLRFTTVSQGASPIHTIFFGGGTPSLLTSKQFEKILKTIRAYFEVIPSDPSATSGTSYSSDTSNTSEPIETSLEANPGTVSFELLLSLRKAGLNRISFGVQSFHLDELRMLERLHDPFDVFDAVRWARRAGFRNLNLDLIYGLPEQTLARWQESLRRAVALAPEHLSLYALTIEHGTPFGRWAAHGLLPLPDPDLAADMYEWSEDFLEEQGYQQYEISNWSLPGFQCRHNLQYWRNLPYLGFGAGAHGCAGSMRVANVLRIKTYIDRLAGNHSPESFGFPITVATVNQIKVTDYVAMQETLMLGLRLTHEGVSARDFHHRFGRDLHDVFGKEIDELIGLGLLEWGSGVDDQGSNAKAVVRLTRRGRLLGNQVFMRFV